MFLGAVSRVTSDWVEIKSFLLSFLIFLLETLLSLFHKYNWNHLSWNVFMSLAISFQKSENIYMNKLCFISCNAFMRILAIIASISQLH
jgi:hypothetical protein